MKHILQFLYYSFITRYSLLLQLHIIVYLFIFMQSHSLYSVNLTPSLSITAFADK